jgi:hypothetical protein
MKPVVIVLRRGRGKKENDGGGKSKIYFNTNANIITYSPVQLLYANNIIN